jgi:hypothetical protein
VKRKFVVLSELDDIKDVMQFCEIYGPAPGCALRSGVAHFCAGDTADAWSNPCLLPLEGISRSYFKTVFTAVDDRDWEHICEIVGNEVGRKIQHIGRLSVFCDTDTFRPCHLIDGVWGGCKVVIGQRDDGEHGMPIERYTQATGVEGRHGDPLEDHPYYRNQKVPVRRLDCYTIDNPCLIDRRIHKSGFQSHAMVVQLVFPSTVLIGEKPAIPIKWGAEV